MNNLRGGRTSEPQEVYGRTNYCGSVNISRKLNSQDKHSFYLNNKLTILSLFFVLISIQSAIARSVAAFSISQLVDESDAIVDAIVSNINVAATTTTFARTQLVTNRITFKADCHVERVLLSKSNLPDNFAVHYSDIDIFGRVSDPFEKGERYIFFLKYSSEGFFPLQFNQGIALVEEGNYVKFYFGKTKKYLFEEFLHFHLSSTTSATQWNELSEKFINETDLEDSNQMIATYCFLFAMPNPEQHESFFLKGLKSSNDGIVLESMRNLMKTGSKEGVAAIVEWYMQTTKSNSWKGKNFFPEHVNEILRFYSTEDLKKVIREYKNKYPQEQVLFNGL